MAAYFHLPRLPERLGHAPAAASLAIDLGIDDADIGFDNHAPSLFGAGTAKADLTPAVYALARDNSWPLRELRRDVRTLETVFNQLATTEAEEEA